MKLAIKSSKIYSGPSIYAQTPVILFSLLEFVTTEEQGVVERVLGALESMFPKLRHDIVSCGAMTETSEIRVSCHLFEHLCMALQDEISTELSCVRSQAAKFLSDNTAIVPYGSYDDPDICLHAAQLAIELMAAAESDQIALSSDIALQQKIEVQLKEFQSFARSRKLKKQDYAFIQAARTSGIPVRKFVGRLLVLGHGQYQQRVNAAKIGLVNVVSNDIAANKDYTRRILSAIGLKVPPYKVVSAGKEAIESAKNIGYPVVVKPNNAGNGKGVTIGVYDRDEVREAYKLAHEFDRSVLIEQFIEGSEYLLLVIKGKFHSALKCLPAHIVGDGFHTIEHLVMQFNSQIHLGNNYPSTKNMLSLDKQADDLLLIQGYDRLSVPAKDVIVYLHRNANPAAGGMAYDVTENVHPDNRMIAERAIRAIGLEFGTVDILTTDIATSMRESNGRINGINSRLGDLLHLWTGIGNAGHARQTLMPMLFPLDRPAKTPIVAVTGIGSTGLMARILANILTKANRKIGLAVEGNIYSVGNPTALKGVSAPQAAQAILLDPDIDIAVLELKPDDVFLNGLDNNPIDHTVIVSPAKAVDDKDTPDSEELDALRLIARTTTGTLYAFEDDGFSMHKEHGDNLPKIYRIRTGTFVPKPVSQPTVSNPASKFWLTLANIGLKSKYPEEEQQPIVIEDFVLFGGLNAEQVETLKSRLNSLASVTGKENALRAILAAYAVAVQLGIEPALAYRALNEFSFD